MKLLIDMHIGVSVNVNQFTDEYKVTILFSIIIH